MALVVERCIVSAMAAQPSSKVVAELRHRLVAATGEGIRGGHRSAALAFVAGIADLVTDEVGRVVGHAHADSRMRSMV